MNAAGTVRLWNPDWRQSSSTLLNQEFIDHVAGLLLSEEQHKDVDKVSQSRGVNLEHHC